MSRISVAECLGLQISGVLYGPIELVHEPGCRTIDTFVPRLCSFLEEVAATIGQPSSQMVIFNQPSWSNLVYLIALALFDRQLSLDAKEVDPGYGLYSA